MLRWCAYSLGSKQAACSYESSRTTLDVLAINVRMLVLCCLDCVRRLKDAAKHSKAEIDFLDSKLCPLHLQNAPAHAERPTPSQATPDTAQFIQDMLRRTEEKREERTQKRLDDYYKRNFTVRMKELTVLFLSWAAHVSGVCCANACLAIASASLLILTYSDIRSNVCRTTSASRTGLQGRVVSPKRLLTRCGSG